MKILNTLKQNIHDYFDELFNKDIPFTETRKGKKWISKTLPDLYNRFFPNNRDFKTTFGQWNVVHEVLSKLPRSEAEKIWIKYFADEKVEVKDVVETNMKKNSTTIRWDVIHNALHEIDTEFAKLNTVCSKTNKKFDIEFDYEKWNVADVASFELNAEYFKKIYDAYFKNYIDKIVE